MGLRATVVVQEKWEKEDYSQGERNIFQLH